MSGLKELLAELTYECIRGTDDIEVTESIKKIGQMIDIPLIDHIIIGDNKYMSFKEAGLL